MKKKLAIIVLFVSLILFYSCEDNTVSDKKMDFDKSFYFGGGTGPIKLEPDSVGPSNGGKKPKPPVSEAGGGN